MNQHKREVENPEGFQIRPFGRSALLEFKEAEPSDMEELERQPDEFTCADRYRLLRAYDMAKNAFEAVMVFLGVACLILLLMFIGSLQK